MKLSFEKLQELIIEETIKLLQEEPYFGASKDDGRLGTPISKRRESVDSITSDGGAQMSAQNKREKDKLKKTNILINQMNKADDFLDTLQSDEIDDSTRLYNARAAFDALERAEYASDRLATVYKDFTKRLPSRYMKSYRALSRLLKDKPAALGATLTKSEVSRAMPKEKVKPVDTSDMVASTVPVLPAAADDGPTLDPIKVVGKMPRKRRRVGSLARKARIQRRLNTKIGRSMEQVQAAVGAEETGKYDRDTYNKIVAWQKANLPATRISRGKKISNYDGLVGPVTFRKMMDQGMGALKKAGAGMLDRGTTTRSQSELDRAKDRMNQSKKLLDDYLKSMVSMQSKLTPEEGKEIRQGAKQFKAQADEDRKEYLALKKKADSERVAQKRRGATKRMASRTKNIEKNL